VRDFLKGTDLLLRAKEKTPLRLVEVNPDTSLLCYHNIILPGKHIITPSPNVLGGTRPLCKITNCRSNALSMNIQTVDTSEYMKDHI